MNALKREISFFDLLAGLLTRKRYIFCCMAFCIIAAVVYILITPKIYRAECRLLPLSQGTEGASAMLAQLSGAAGMLGFSSPKTTSDLLIGLMQGDGVVDRVVDRFKLMELYRQNSRIKMRELVKNGVLYLKEDVKSNILSVFVLDEEPERAAAIANAFVEELEDKLRTMSLGEAAQRRVFFEEQVKTSRMELENAEDALTKYQEESGIVAEEPQVSAALTARANLRAQIAAKEVELSAMRTWARKGNPFLKRAESELAALKNEAARLEDQGGGSGKDSIETAPSLRQLPAVGLEYQRRLRAVKYAAVMYEMMLKQWDAAKLDESKEALRFQILDPATPPDWKFKPKRASVLIFSALLGLALGLLWALGAHSFQTLKEDETQREALERIKAACSWRRK